MDILITKKNNSLVMPESINFTELVRNSNTTLTLSYQSNMIDLLNKEFTEEESQWYIANLYIYLNYHPTDDYPINLENIYKVLGFANKGNAMKTIISNFIENEDYKIIKNTNKLREDCLLVRMEKQTNRGGHNREDVMLNIDTFKNLAMLVKTPEGTAIRKYYIKMENIHNKVVKMEIDEQKLIQANTQKLLEEKEQQIEQLENKPELEGFIKKSGYIYIIIDTILTILKNTGHIKLGSCGDDKINTRLSQLNVGSSTGSLKLIQKFKTFDVKFVEEMVHSALEPLRIRNRKEWFYFSNKNEYDYIVDTIEKCIEFTNQFNIKNLKDFEKKISLLKKTHNLNDFLVKEKIEEKIDVLSKRLSTTLSRVDTFSGQRHSWSGTC